MASRDTPPAASRATKSAATRSLCPPSSCRRPNVVPVVSVECPAKVAPTCHDAQYRPVFEKSRKGGVTQGHAMSPVVSLGQLAADLRAGLLFCTLLPRPGAATITATYISRARVAPTWRGPGRFACSMRLAPPARADGLSVGVGTPPRASAIAAVLIGIVALAIGLGPAAGVCAFALFAVAFASLAWLSVRQIGGQTGDVLGALEQIGEIVVLLVAAANVGG